MPVWNIARVLSTLAEHRDRLRRIEKRTERLEHRMATQEEEAQKLATQDAELSADFETLKGLVTDLQNQINNSDNASPELQQAVDDITAHVDAMHQYVTNQNPTPQPTPEPTPEPPAGT